MRGEKRGLWRNKWFYIAVLVLVAWGGTFVAGMWFAGGSARSVAEVVDSYTKVYGGSDSTKDVAALVPLYADDCVFRDIAADRTYEGIAEIKVALNSLLATPEFDLSVEQTLVGDDWAIVEWTADGVNTRTGRLAQVGGVTLLETAKGKIAREVWYYDPAKAPF